MFCFMDGQYNWSMASCTTFSCAGSAGILSSCIELVGRIDVVAQFFFTIILPNSCISFFTGPLALCVMSLVMLGLFYPNNLTNSWVQSLCFPQFIMT